MSRVAELVQTGARHDKNSKDNPRRRREAPHVVMTPPRPALACAASAFSGFSALVYEVAFTRLLALVIGPTTYAFATMAASFIIGLAFGSAAGARLSRRVRQPALWLAAMLLVSAISASLVASFAASRLPLIVASQVAAANATFQSVVLRQAFEVALLMLPMTFAFGVAFPLALAIGSSGVAAAGRDTARVYVANTLGAIGGALTAGFFLVPQLGLRGTFVGMSRVGTIGGVMLAAAVLAPRAGGTVRRLGVIGALAAGGLLATLVDVPRWDRNLLSSGAYKYAPYIHPDDAGDFETSLRAAAARRSSGSDAHRSTGPVRYWSWQRCHRGLRAGHRSGPPRRRHRDFAGGRRGVGVLLSGERRCSPRSRSPPGGRRWQITSAADHASIRRCRLRAVEPVDGRRRRALHARVLQGGTCAAQARWASLPMGAYLRYE